MCIMSALVYRTKHDVVKYWIHAHMLSTIVAEDRQLLVKCQKH